MLSKKIDTKLELDALNITICNRNTSESKFIHHSDRGSQYFSSISRQRLKKDLKVHNASSTGDSYDNAKVECTNSFHKS